MDNSLISIDDLVRQRLDGGEERERSGAWLRMSELLDKEMPKRPAAFMWRRMFSALGVLLLIATITVGSYEFSAFKNMGGNNNMPVAVASTTSEKSFNTTSKNNTASNEVTDNTQLSTTGTPGNEPGKNETNNKIAIAANETHPAHKNTHKNSATASAVAKEGNAKTGDKKTTDDAAAPITSKTAQAKVGNMHTAPTSNNKAAANNAVTSNNSSANNAVASAGKPVKKHTARTLSQVPAGNTTNSQLAGIAGATNNSAVAANSKTLNHKSHATGTGSANVKPAGMNTLPLGSNMPGTVKNNVTNTSTNSKVAGNKKAKTGNVALNNRTIGKLNTTNANAAKPIEKKIASTSAGLSGNNKVKAAGKAVKTNVVSSGNTVNKIAGANASSPMLAKGPATSGASANTTSVPAVNNNVAQKCKKPLERTVVLQQHYLKITPNSSIYHIDTISDKSISEEFDILNTNGDNNTNGVNSEPVANNSAVNVSPVGNTTATGGTAANTPSHHSAARTSGATSSATAPVTNATTPGNTTTTATASNTGGPAPINNPAATNGPGNYSGATASSQTPNSQVLPGSSLSASAEKSSLGKKETTADKQSKGAEELQKIQSSFNDIKYKVGAMQFAPGLTAGINGTFFGPNSFKGFQFGVSGTFVFSDAISILTELKYFHRINNDYVLNDNYYSYTANGPSSYTKEQVQNTYSFSTLHSFEMPLIIRYSKGSFNFFAGGNLVYTFSINTGAATLAADPSTATKVTAIGNDNAPKLNASDFGARFGLGYLFGVSYNVSPNVTLDLRDVQTAWDNAGSAGAKEVSSQLYKSPSFQFSLGYRLGGNKHKE